jgi:hypothetical protein
MVAFMLACNTGYTLLLPASNDGYIDPLALPIIETIWTPLRLPVILTT